MAHPNASNVVNPDSKTLKFDTRGRIPNATRVFVLDNGLTFFYKYDYPQQFYVTARPNFIKCARVGPRREVWDIEHFGVIGNAIYFAEDGKILRVELIDEEIVVSKVRDVLRNERTHRGALCSMVIDGKTHVYRMADDPEKDAVVVDIDEEILKDLQLEGIQGGKVVYSSPNDLIKHSKKKSVVELGANAILVKCEGSIFVGRNSSIFIHIAHEEFVLTYDTTRKGFLPRLRTGNISILEILNVNRGIIYVKAIDLVDGEAHKMTALFPHRQQHYFANEDRSTVEHLPVDNTGDDLIFEKHQKLPFHSHLLIVNDGTQYYFKHNLPQELQVKDNTTTAVRLQQNDDGNKIRNLGSHGNAIYFVQSQKIYQAVVHQNKIDISCLRPLQPMEWTHNKGFCSCILDGRMYAYRACDDPIRDGIVVDCPIKALYGLTLEGIQGGIAVYTICGDRQKPSMRKIGENAVLIAYEGSIFVGRYTAPFVYIASGELLFTLDIHILQFLPPQKMNAYVRRIIRVSYEVIYVEGIPLQTTKKERNSQHLFTAQLAH